MPPRLRFGDVEIDLDAFELRRGGALLPVEPQVFELLTHLARNPGRLVTKDELIETVWNGRIVSDATLASRIKSARRAIGDDGEQQKWITTVHGRGVRFVAEVAGEPPAAETRRNQSAPGLVRARCADAGRARTAGHRGPAVPELQAAGRTIPSSPTAWRRRSRPRSRACAR